MEPSYLLINHFSVVTNGATQGSSSQIITEAFVYIDDQIAGVYHLPASIPFALTGSHSIKIAPAIIENAIASNPRHAYTFLTAFDTIINFTAANPVTIFPVIGYRSSVKFALIEDFENPLPLFTKTTYNTIDTLTRDSIPADNMEPGHCALFEIKNGILMEYATRNKYSLPSSAISETFLEINYKSELPLAIGLYIDEPTTIIKTGVVTLNAKASWSKAYINLTGLVSARPFGTKYSLFISAANADINVKNVFVDNIKILHFE